MHRQENFFRVNLYEPTFFDPLYLVSTSGFPWLKLLWNALNARLTMSLSPILSMIKDFLIVFVEAVEFGGPRLRDMCNDVGAILLFSSVEEFLLLCNVELFNFFIED